MAGGEGEHLLGGLDPGLAGRRRDHLDVLRHHDQRLGDLVDVEGVGRLHHDRVPALEAGDVLEHAPIGVAVAGHREVADLAGQGRLRVVPGALDVEHLLEAHALGEGELGAVEGGHVHLAPHHGVAGRLGHGRRALLARRDLLGVDLSPLLLEAVDDPGLLAIGDHIGPPQLPHQEQQQEHAEGQQQLAEHTDQRAAAASTMGGAAHRITVASTVREPSKAGRVVSSSVSTFSPRPTWSTHSR